MHQYIDGQWAYNYVNGLANYILRSEEAHV